MPQFTVIGKKRVFRVKAKSVQALTKAMRSVGLVWQAVYEDKPEQPRSKRRVHPEPRQDAAVFGAPVAGLTQT